MAELNITRRCRGVAISSITCLEKHVLDLHVEGKEKLSHKDEVAIKVYIKRLENLDADFKGFIAVSLTWLRRTIKSCCKDKPS